jgi:hypothetical protein
MDTQGNECLVEELQSAEVSGDDRDGLNAAHLWRDASEFGRSDETIKSLPEFELTSSTAPGDQEQPKTPPIENDPIEEFRLREWQQYEKARKDYDKAEEAFRFPPFKASDKPGSTAAVAEEILKDGLTPSVVEKLRHQIFSEYRNREGINPVKELNQILEKHGAKVTIREQYAPFNSQGATGQGGACLVYLQLEKGGKAVKETPLYRDSWATVERGVPPYKR